MSLKNAGSLGLLSIIFSIECNTALKLFSLGFLLIIILKLPYISPSAFTPANYSY